MTRLGEDREGIKNKFQYKLLILMVLFYGKKGELMNSILLYMFNALCKVGVKQINLSSPLFVIALCCVLSYSGLVGRRNKAKQKTGKARS